VAAPATGALSLLARDGLTLAAASGAGEVSSAAGAGEAPRRCVLAEGLSLPAADAPRVWVRADDDEPPESLLSAKAAGMSATP
jgi:hypothetical protein